MVSPSAVAPVSMAPVSSAARASVYAGFQPVSRRSRRRVELQREFERSLGRIGVPHRQRRRAHARPRLGVMPVDVHRALGVAQRLRILAHLQKARAAIGVTLRIPSPALDRPRVVPHRRVRTDRRRTRRSLSRANPRSRPRRAPRSRTRTSSNSSASNRCADARASRPALDASRAYSFVRFKYPPAHAVAAPQARAPAPSRTGPASSRDSVPSAPPRVVRAARASVTARLARALDRVGRVARLGPRELDRSRRVGRVGRVAHSRVASIASFCEAFSPFLSRRARPRSVALGVR